MSEVSASDVGPQDRASAETEDTVAFEEDSEIQSTHGEETLPVRSLDSGVVLASVENKKVDNRKRSGKGRESAASSEVTEPSPAPGGDVIDTNSPRRRPARAAGLAGAAANTAFMNSRRRGLKPPDSIAAASTRPSSSLLPPTADVLHVGASKSALRGGAAPSSSSSTELNSDGVERPKNAPLNNSTCPQEAGDANQQEVSTGDDRVVSTQSLAG